MSTVSFRIKQDKAESRKQKMTVTGVEVAITKFLFGTCDCTLDSDVGTGDFSLVFGILHLCGHVHMRSYVSPGMRPYSTASFRCYSMSNALRSRYS